MYLESNFYSIWDFSHEFTQDFSASEMRGGNAGEPLMQLPVPGPLGLFPFLGCVW